MEPMLGSVDEEECPGLFGKSRTEIPFERIVENMQD
jgi:hypothetical protein